MACRRARHFIVIVAILLCFDVAAGLACISIFRDIRLRFPAFGFRTDRPGAVFGFIWLVCAHATILA
jgi:hypothetical protein